MLSLDEITQKIRASAKKVLADGRAEVVIGYRAGSTPLAVAPFFARNEADCDQLVWSNFARLNLANYLPKRPGKVAIIAKGCDARSVVGHVAENQILRENIYVIGVPCTGMVEISEITAKEARPIAEATENANTITIKGEGFSTDLNKAEVMRRNCKTCAHRTPETADELIGEAVPGAQPDDYADLKALLEKPAAEKMAYFKGLVTKCLRCYACRNACPLCYCPVCFVDETRPQWLGKSQDEMDTFTFHILRGYHCAGRCTSCGACESACPVDIKVREFNRIMEATVSSTWNYEPGLSYEQKPPLTTYRPDDEAEFIK